MTEANVEVRFKRPKRYPHPNGPRRAAGTVLPITASLAALWVQRGVVEYIEAEREPFTLAAYEELTVGEVEAHVEKGDLTLEQVREFEQQRDKMRKGILELLGEDPAGGDPESTRETREEATGIAGIMPEDELDDEDDD